MTLDDLEDYVRLCHPDIDDPTERANAIRAEVEAGDREIDDIFVIRSRPEHLDAACRLHELAPLKYQLTRLRRHPEVTLTEETLNALTHDILARAKALNAKSVEIRELTDNLTPEWRSALEGAGFRFIEERIEYKTPVEDLPVRADDDPSPLRWASMRVTGQLMAAAMLETVSEGTTFGLEPGETGAEVLDDFLSDDSLTCDEDCVAIGFLDGNPVAFLCVQVATDDSGWSRITYMGLIPSARRHGLGRHVHLRGFDRIRAMGGTLYHGGTAMENVGMRRLFETHGCVESARLTELRWTAAAVNASETPAPEA